MSAEYVGVSLLRSVLKAAKIEITAEKESLLVGMLDIEDDRHWLLICDDIQKGKWSSRSYVISNQMHRNGETVVRKKMTELSSKFPKYRITDGVKNIAGQNIFYIRVEKNDHGMKQ